MFDMQRNHMGVETLSRRQDAGRARADHQRWAETAHRESRQGFLTVRLRALLRLVLDLGH